MSFDDCVRLAVAILLILAIVLEGYALVWTDHKAGHRCREIGLRLLVIAAVIAIARAVLL